MKMRTSHSLTSSLAFISSARSTLYRHSTTLQQRLHSRLLHIKATPSTTWSSIDEQPLSSNTTGTADVESPDARFEVLGAPHSLLSVSLSASQNLYTRRGTLVGVSGKAENTLSTLSILKPLRSSALGIPFLYQKISSISPLTLLISTKLPASSFAVIHLNGTIDWIVAQRKALLAWTGHSLLVRPILNLKMSLAHWGNSEVSGRGLLALVCHGQVYQITLKPGEEFIVHPSNVVAYTITPDPPLPYRLRSSSLNLQLPSINFFPDSKFLRTIRESDTWTFVRRMYMAIQRWSRRTIWGDRLFLRFQGPTTLLLQSRASRLRDVLTNRDVDEIAQTEPGQAKMAESLKKKMSSTDSPPGPDQVARTSTGSTSHLSYASVQRDGKVRFQDTDSFESFIGSTTSSSTR